MKRLVIILALALAASLLLAACGGGGATSEPAYDPAVTPLTGADLENVSGIANSAGVKPCGVFDVNGFGEKNADVVNFPNCQAAKYDVLCLNGQALWVGDHIKEVRFDSARVSFTSEQEGFCGLFPAQ
jgi:hypothetical protein